MQAAEDNDLSDFLDELRGAGATGVVRRLRDCLWSEPGHPFALAALGDALRDIGELEAAVEALERAHYLEPDSIDILCRYGEALADVGREREARLRFEAALRLHPGHRGARERMEALERPAPTAPSRRNSPATRPLDSVRPLPARANAAAHSNDPGVWLNPQTPLPENLVDAEHPQGVIGILRAVLQAWASQPILWVAVPAALNTLAYLIAAIDPTLTPLVAGPCWAAALSLLMGPLLLAAANQFRHSEPFAGECRPTGARLARAVGLAMPYTLVLIGGTSILLSHETALNAETTVLASLLLTAPFHAAFGPALVLAATEGPGGLAALRAAPRLVTRRAWTQLVALLAIGVLAAVVLLLVGLAFSREIQVAGELGLVARIGALSVAESLWIVAIGVCGADSIDFQDDYLAARTPASSVGYR